VIFLYGALNLLRIARRLSPLSGHQRPGKAQAGRKRAESLDKVLLQGSNRGKGGIEMEYLLVLGLLDLFWWLRK